MIEKHELEETTIETKNGKSKIEKDDENNELWIGPKAHFQNMRLAQCPENTVGVFFWAFFVSATTPENVEKPKRNARNTRTHMAVSRLFPCEKIRFGPSG